MNMTPYQACQEFTALKTHFISDQYDYFKYAGKTTLFTSNSGKAFESHKDRFIYVSLAKKYTHSEFQGFVLANILKNNTQWVGNLKTEDADFIYIQWLKRMESFTYVYEQNLEKIFDWADKANKPVDKIFELGETQQNSPFLMMYYKNTIYPETFLVLDFLFHLLSRYNKTIKDTLIWPDHYKMLVKYEPFVRSRIDFNKMAELTKNKAKEYLKNE